LGGLYRKKGSGPARSVRETTTVFVDSVKGGGSEGRARVGGKGRRLLNRR